MKFAWLVVLLSAGLWAQQNIPDAPVPASTPFSNKPLQPAAEDTPTPNTGNGESSSSQNAQQSGSGDIAPIVHPTPVAPTAAATPGETDGEIAPSSVSDLPTYTSHTNFVLVPVTVKDSSGHLVQGLQPRDFAVYEEGQLQNIRYFTSDAFPLSIAFVVDENLRGNTMKRVNASLGAVVGALSPYDEVSVFTYGNNWKQESDFTNAGNKLSITLKSIQDRPIETSQPENLGGPLSSSNDGPTVNNMHIDPSVARMPTPPKEYHLLNDALFNAAQQLAKRPDGRRRIIFVISAGVEAGSRASSKVVLQTLLEDHVTVYGMNVGEGSVPIVNVIDRLHVPKVPIYYNLVPKYASHTGGSVYSEFSEEAIQDAYMKVTQEARDQYTLGYYSHSSQAPGHKTPLEVRVHRSNLKVYAREGFYPLPTKPVPANR